MLDSIARRPCSSNLPMLRDLAEKAPDDLADEWQTFLGALEGLDKALKDAGVKPSDFKDGKPPAGLSAADQKAIADAAGQIGSDEVVAGRLRIEQQARDVCKVNLGPADWSARRLGSDVRLGLPTCGRPALQRPTHA